MSWWRRGEKEEPRRALGRQGEDLAARHLRRLGYSILERNVRTALGEIDLIARQGDLLIFVEVKTKKTGAFTPPELSVDRRKQRKLASLALEYLARKGGERWGCRFDVVAVTLPPGGRPEVLHIRDAFRPEEGGR